MRDDQFDPGQFDPGIPGGADLPPLAPDAGATSPGGPRRGRRVALAVLVTGAVALGAGAVVMFSHPSGQPVAGSDPAVASAASATPSGSAPVGLAPARLPVRQLSPATSGGTRTPAIPGASPAPTTSGAGAAPTGGPVASGQATAKATSPASVTPLETTPSKSGVGGVMGVAGDTGMPSTANMAVCRQMSAVLAAHAGGTLQGQTCRASRDAAMPGNDLVELQALVVTATGTGHVTLSTAGNSTMPSGVRATASRVASGVDDPRAVTLVGDGHAAAHAWQDIVVTNMDQEKGTVRSAQPPLTRAGVLSLLEDDAWAGIDAAWLRANPQG